MKGLIFDFDGTILDTETPVYESWKAVFTEHGVELPIELYAKCVGSSYDKFDPVEYLNAELASVPNWEEITPKRRAHYRKLLQGNGPLPGVIELLDEAKNKGIKRAIASSSPRSWVQPLLRELEIESYFDTIVTLDDVNAPKPAPDLFEKALKAMQISPLDAVAVEDSPNGCTAAKAAGVFCVVVPNHVTKALKFKGADLRYDSLTETNLTDLTHKIDEKRSELTTLEAGCR